MKRIDAVIRTQNLDQVKDRLIEIGVEGMTIADARGFGRQKGHEIYRGVEYTVDFLPRLQITIIAPDERVPVILDAIVEGARTGEIGDGKIFVSAIEEVVRIRSREWTHAV